MDVAAYEAQEGAMKNIQKLEQLHWAAIARLKARLAEAKNNATMRTDREVFMEGVYSRLGKENPRPTWEKELISRLEGELSALRALTPQEYLARALRK